MAIGRPDGRDTPWHPTAHPTPLNVFGNRPRNPSGPAATAAPQGRTHDRTRTAANSAPAPSHPRGRPHMDARIKSGKGCLQLHLLTVALWLAPLDPAVAIAQPDSRWISGIYCRLVHSTDPLARRLFLSMVRPISDAAPWPA